VRIVLRLFGLDILDLDITTESDDNDDTAESLRPPFGFAGSGQGFIATADDTMLDSLETS